MDELKILQKRFYNTDNITREELQTYKLNFQLYLSIETNELILSELNRMLRVIDALELCVPHG